MSNRLFDRTPQPSIDEESQQAPVEAYEEASLPEARPQEEYANPAGDRIDQLEREVDHLRACIDQLLDMVEGQPDPTDELMLLSDRTSFVERRMQRVEDGVGDLRRKERRRVGDHE